MLHLIRTILAALIGSLAYIYFKFLEKRRQLDGLPQPPMKYKLLGHIPIAAELTRLFPPSVHGHMWSAYIYKKYGLGDIFYIDWWPLGPRFLFIADPELASQYITTGQNLPKSYLETAYLDEFLGRKNMVSLEGGEWKTVRSIFNPGFAASHLMTLAEYIVDASLDFVEVMKAKAASNEHFKLEEFTTRLTIDIIGKVVLDADFESQKAVHPIVKAFRIRVDLMPPSATLIPWEALDPIRRFRLWWNARTLDRLIGNELDHKLARRLAGKSSGPKSSKDRKRSVIDLALDAYQKESKGSQKQDNPSGAPNTSSVIGKFRTVAINNIKTFIFAGHDTSSSTIAYSFYLLHLHPKVHDKIIKELDLVFGASCSMELIASAIKKDSHIINRLEYLNAFIKEVMRVFPPASTLRYTDEPGLFITDPKTGAKLPLTGWHVWHPMFLIGRNEDFFPQPAKFIPERFIPSQTPFPNTKLFTPAGKDAWRPFEKGPRNCIGQELALIETRIILALVVKQFDFVAEYDGEKLNSWTPVDIADEMKDGENGKARMRVEGHRCYQILKGTAKPIGGMPGRIYVRE